MGKAFSRLKMAVNWLYCRGRGGTAETFIMGRAGLLKAGMAKPTNIFMERISLFVMGRTAKSSNG